MKGIGSAGGPAGAQTRFPPGACLPDDPWFLAGGFALDRRLERMGVRHGTTTRALGDMGLAPRRRAALEAAGAAGETGLWLKQVHGDRVVLHALSAPCPAGTPEADGWMARAPSRPLCVTTADCAPLLLWGPGARFGGVFHVGWRGAALAFAAGAAAALCREFGCRPEDLAASVGPHVGPCCYRVGPEVSSRFRRESLLEGPGGASLDLGREVAAQLRDAGVPAGSVAVCRQCTSCRADLFYSFRRDKARASMMTFLVLGS